MNKCPFSQFIFFGDINSLVASWAYYLSCSSMIYSTYLIYFCSSVISIYLWPIYVSFYLTQNKHLFLSSLPMISRVWNIFPTKDQFKVIYLIFECFCSHIFKTKPFCCIIWECNTVFSQTIFSMLLLNMAPLLISL